MVEDKYVGLALAVSGTVAIGSSFIITKKVPVASLQSYEHFYHPPHRVSMKQEKEGIRTLRHRMTTLISKIRFGGWE